MKLNTAIIAVVAMTTMASMAKPTEPALNWRYYTYEPETPRLVDPLDGAKLTASGQWSDRSPDFVIDGKIEAHNHWACEELPAVLTIEMQAQATLRTSRIWFFFGQPRVYKFFIEASTDGTTWSRVADWTKNELPSTAEGFLVPFKNPVKARFLQVTITDSSVPGAGGHIVEFQVSENEFLTEGLCGRHMPLERVTAANAQGDTTLKTWHATAWRNERVHGQFVVWSSEPVPQLRLACTALRTEKGAEIPADALTPRFVRYVMANKQVAGDILDTAERVDLPSKGFRPVWLTVAVPAKTRPGLYCGTLTVTGQGQRELTFPLELEVLAAQLPEPSQWKFFLDLWQHPWAVARYHDVTPFSKAHYEFLKPIYRELAGAGQKVLTVTITDRPWGHQNFDAYHSMITRYKHADGSWTSDYRLLDEYVKFGRRCGIGPQIHCYSMAAWGNRASYTDVASGDNISIALQPGTSEYEDYWGPFLRDFEQHMRRKGWVDDTFIAMDERGPKETKATADCVKKYAPRLKIAMPGNKPPSHFKGIELANYCQFIAHIDDSFLRESAQRREQGMVTTYYVCCGPARPNTFTVSPPDEQVWLGIYAAANGLDGFLRWAFVNWPRDPLFDSGFGNWKAGDTFLLYPGPRSSVRWEMLRDGIEEAEKIHWLQEHKLGSEVLDAVLGEFNYKRATKMDDTAITDLVQRARLAIESAARRK